MRIFLKTNRFGEDSFYDSLLAVEKDSTDGMKVEDLKKAIKHYIETYSKKVRFDLTKIAILPNDAALFTAWVWTANEDEIDDDTLAIFDLETQH